MDTPALRRRILQIIPTVTMYQTELLFDNANSSEENWLDIPALRRRILQIIPTVTMTQVPVEWIGWIFQQ